MRYTHSYTIASLLFFSVLFTRCELPLLTSIFLFATDNDTHLLNQIVIDINENSGHFIRAKRYAGTLRGNRAICRTLFIINARFDLGTIQS